MSLRSRKDCLSICGRSGIETLKHNLVRDGYFRGLWVLPEYYEPPQFQVARRPVPELPPFNPQPLIDVYPQTVNLGQISSTPPYVLSATGKFGFHQEGDLLTSLEVITSLGSFGFMADSKIHLIGIEVLSATKIYSQDPGEPYGGNGYGTELYGGYADIGPDFIIGFNGIIGAPVTTATGTFQFGDGYGESGYGDNGYGE